MCGDFHASLRILIALQKDKLQRLHCSFMTHFMAHFTTQLDCEQSLFGQSRLSSAGLERANSRERGKRECEASERGTARSLQRNKSFFLPFLLVGPEIHNSTNSFLFYDILNFVYNIFFLISVFQVTCCVRGMGFRGVINVILRKQIGMSRSFSFFLFDLMTYTVFTNGGHAGKNWCLVMKARRWRINKNCKWRLSVNLQSVEHGFHLK